MFGTFCAAPFGVKIDQKEKKLSYSQFVGQGLRAFLEVQEEEKSTKKF